MGPDGLVEILEIGVGARAEEIDFSTDQDGCNHVIESGSGYRVGVFPLDDVSVQETPALLKIDVEGFEANVITRAHRVLKDDVLEAVIIEMNGCGTRYGFDDHAIDSEMRRFGFDSFPMTHGPAA